MSRLLRPRLPASLLPGLGLVLTLLFPSQGRAQVAAYTVVDFHSSYILEQANANQVQPIASLTKVATACVALDWLERADVDPGSLIVVPPGAAQTGGVNPLGLRPGDRISVRDALYSALMASDNIAALSVANAVGADLKRRRGDNRDPITVFVREMNALAGLLDMRETTFRDPHGLGDPQGRQSTSTANDLARLGISAMERASLRFYVSQQERNVTVHRAGGPQQLRLRNTNELVGQNGIDGVKTGQTAAAGPCLIISAPRQALQMTDATGQTVIRPRRLVVVVLNSPNRFAEAAGLLQRGWGRYEDWVRRGTPVDDASLMLRRVE